MKCSGKEWMVFLEYLRVVKDGKDRKAEGRAMASGGEKTGNEKYGEIICHGGQTNS